MAGALAGGYTENYGTNMFYEIDASADSNGHVTFVTRSLCCAAALVAIHAERRAAAAGVWVFAVGTAVRPLRADHTVPQPQMVVPLI